MPAPVCPTSASVSPGAIVSEKFCAAPARCVLVGERHVAELDLADAAAPARWLGLDHPRLGIDQREDPLAGRQTLLELAPERGDAGQREPEQRDRLQKQIPVAGRDVAVDHLLPPDLDQRGRAQPGDGEEHREDAAEDEALLQPDPVGCGR